MSVALLLPEPVGVDVISVPADRFHCPVYDATLTAASCGARQRAAREAGPRGQYGKCFECAIGRRVTERVGARQAAEAVQRCAYGQCQAGAVDGDYCTLHGRVARRQSIAPQRRRPLSEDPELAAAAAEREARVRLEIAAAAAHTRQTTAKRIEEDQSMAKQCAKPDCKREADATKGDGTLCMPHHRGVLNAEIQAGKPKQQKRPAKSARPKRAPGRAKASPAKRSVAVADLPRTALLRQAVEALELVDAIGWDLARQLAARVQASA